MADVYSVQQDLGPRYQPRAVWLASNTTQNRMRQFVAAADATNAPIYDGSGTRLLGKPVYEVSTLDSTVSAGKHPLVYLDPSSYTIVDRVGMQVELVQHLFGPTRHMPTGQRGLFAMLRVGGGITTQAGVRVLEIKS